MRICSFSLVLALIGAASGGCAMMDSNTDGDAKLGTETSALSAFVLTVGADENSITVTSSAPTNTCPAFSTCNFAYLQGTTLTIKTALKNLIDCEIFNHWDGACAGQGSTCTVVINSDISTNAFFGPLSGCIPK
jgi:hypothetical protein